MIVLLGRIWRPVEATLYKQPNEPTSTEAFPPVFFDLSQLEAFGEAPTLTRKPPHNSLCP